MAFTKLKCFQRRYSKRNTANKVSLQHGRSCSSKEGSICSSSKKTSVTFDKIVIRNYHMTLGDNPSCSSGPPIGLDWSYNSVDEELKLDEYETFREGKRLGVKRLKVGDRYRILRMSGIPHHQIAFASVKLGKFL